MAFDESKKEVVENLGLFKFDDDKGLYEFEIVRYDGGVAKTSYRRFNVKQGDDGPTVTNNRLKSWVSDSETEALLAGFSAANKWHVANPAQEKGNGKTDTVYEKEAALTAKLRSTQAADA
jgi:hypothetical protein